MDPDTSSSRGNLSSCFNSHQSYNDAYEDSYNPQFHPQRRMQNYRGHSAFDAMNDTRDIHSGHNQYSRRRQRNFHGGQKQNYRGNFTDGKSWRRETGSVKTADDNAARDRCPVLDQEDEVDGGLMKESSENFGEDKSYNFSGDDDIQRKQTNRKTNRGFGNPLGTESRSASRRHKEQDVYYDQSYNVHEWKNDVQQHDSWSRNHSGSNSELEVRHASDRYGRGYRGRGRNRPRQKPDNYSKNCDNSNRERWSDNRNSRNFHSEDQNEADAKETDWCLLPTSKEDMDSDQLELPTDSHSNSSSSRSSANYWEPGVRSKSGFIRDGKSLGELELLKSDRHSAQNPSRSNGRYDFPCRFNRKVEANENYPSGLDKNSFACEQQVAKGEYDEEDSSDLNKGGHYKSTGNRSQNSSGKHVLKKSESQDASSFASSQNQDERNKASWNSNGSQRQQRRSAAESKNNPAGRKQNWRDRNTKHTAFKTRNLDDRATNESFGDEQLAVDEKQDVCDKSECLNLQKAEEKDDKSNLGSGNAETISSKVKESESVKKFNQHPKNPNSGQKRDLPQASKWQDETQRGLLVEQLSAGKYECLVCCNVIRREAAVWSCTNCYHIYHMYCIKKWAQSPAAATASSEATGIGWRCPTCQNPYHKIPNQYTCFCGKMKDPEFNSYSTPHSCNETCGKERSRGCPHLCNILCHPGPCPPCSAFVMRSCDCGKTKRSVKCAGDATSFKCNEPCHRTLNCGLHDCPSSCHAGPCEPCGVMIEQRCHCEQEIRTVKCGSAESFVKMFSCDKICSRKLACGVHTCGDICHPGPCEECPFMPSKVTHCPCGKTLLSEIPNSKPRETCEDSVPTCGKKCGKELLCGNEGRKHRCKQICHGGPCATTCKRTTEVTCRCGAVTKDLSCVEFLKITESSPFICDRRCKKKMSCGRHKCGQLCCVSTEHECQLLCGYKLSCGIHRCEERCHRGNCPSCWQVSFDELRCHCGAEVRYPPVPCGAGPPECHRPCTREHPCSHQATHHCHSENTCPPCTVLTQKWCLGHHELRSNIPCYVTEISCGMQCGKELPCVIHKCLQACHKGSCLEGQVCTQPCPMIREKCGHPCQAPCHQGSPCPATACKAEITLQCECGRRKEKGQCLCGNDAGSQSDYTKMTAQYVASKLWEGQSIDLSVLTKEGGVNKKTRKLQCNSECSIMERNQRLALALEIKNPDLSSKLGNPPYSQFLKDFARQNPTFVANVEKALSSVVTTAQQAKISRKSHAFKVMPSTQRRVIHELAEFYGCQTESYDEEPNKNVVATAVKGKCWLPNVTLTALVQRELFPKAPIPIPINCKEEQIRSAAQDAKQSTEVFGTAKPPGGNSKRQKEAQIDYFDITD